MEDLVRRSGSEAGSCRDFRSETIAELERYAETRSQLESAQDPPDDLQYWLMTLRYGELEAKAHLDWSDEVLAELNAGDSGSASSVNEPQESPE